MSDWWYPGALARQDLPPEFTPPEVPPQPGLIERMLPKVYDPLQKQQQEVAKAAVNFTPMGSLADLYDAYANKDPLSFGAAVAGVVPAGKILGKGVKAAKEVAEATSPVSKAGTTLEHSAIARPNVIERYVTDPQRVANPGVYKRPDVIAREAAANVAPEHEALKKLFGVTRDDLYEISERGTRKGNIEPEIWMPGKATRGSYAASAIMNPANAQRMIDTLAEAQKYPALIKGMDPWYVMDPLYQRMVKLVGPEEAKLAYARLNATVGPFSAGSNVATEINRGTAAHMGVVQGNYPEFRRFAGVAEKDRGRNFPEWLRDVKGHAYHGVQADPVTRWLATGQHGYDKDTVKIPLYMQASGVPQTGFQTRLPVPDAHFTRAAGMPDVRRNQDFNDYMGGSEYRPFGAWYRENVAKPLGIEAVPAQARMWGTYAPQTGVDTKIGAGKLELISQNIWERAQRLGIDPHKLRDDVLMGKEHALWILGIPAAGALAGKMGGVAAQDQYQ